MDFRINVIIKVMHLKMFVFDNCNNLCKQYLTGENLA